MANIRKFDHATITVSRKHTDVDATIAMVEVGGEQFMQIDTFGSGSREFPGKLSQTIRLTKSAYQELVDMGKFFN